MDVCRKPSFSQGGTTCLSSLHATVCGNKRPWSAREQGLETAIIYHGPAVPQLDVSRALLKTGSVGCKKADWHLSQKAMAVDDHQNRRQPHAQTGTSQVNMQ